MVAVAVLAMTLRLYALLLLFLISCLCGDSCDCWDCLINDGCADIDGCIIIDALTENCVESLLPLSPPSLPSCPLRSPLPPNNPPGLGKG